METSFELTSQSEELPPFRANLRNLLKEASFDEKVTGEICLAVDECLTNVIRHAYGNDEGKIEVLYKDDQDKIQISIRDYGKKFDPTGMPDPELPPTKPGGLGIYLTKELMDSVEYDQGFSEGNMLHLVKFKNAKG